MKLFLASSLDKTLSLFKNKLDGNKKYKVIFIANAADPFEDQWWVEADRKEFIKQGFELMETDLRNLDGDQLKSELASADIVHVCGGSVFYLLSIVKQKGIDTAIIESVKNGKVIYTGTSAGSILASTSNEIYKHDPEESKYSNLLSNYSGLGLVKFLIVPHCNNPEFVDALFLLNDNQAIWVEDDRFELLIG
jgi:peptidase E